MLPPPPPSNAQALATQVLFLVSDDLRPEMGVYGGKAITPNVVRTFPPQLDFQGHR